MSTGVTGTTASAKAEAVGTQRINKLKEKIKDPFFWSDWLVVVAFIAVVAFFGAIAPESYLTTYNLNNILVAASIPAIIAVGQTFTVATAGIDLSVSSTMTLQKGGSFQTTIDTDRTRLDKMDG